MKQVKAIKFVFENTDATPYIECENIERMRINKINTVIQNVAINCVCKMDIAHDIYIKLFLQANDKYNELNDEKYPIYIFDRVAKYNDITSIELKYYDDTTETIYPVYKEEKNNPSNIYQTSYQENDCLIIKINDEKNI